MSLLKKRFLAGIIANEPCGAFGCSNTQEFGSQPSSYSSSKKKHKIFRPTEDPWDPKNFETGLEK